MVFTLWRFDDFDHAILKQPFYFPFIDGIARETVEPCEIGGYNLRVGSTVVLSQWITHRDPRYYDDPEAFHPERWLDGLADRLPPGAYFPFGDGPRRCIGASFALIDVNALLAPSVSLQKLFCVHILDEPHGVGASFAEQRQELDQ